MGRIKTNREIVIQHYPNGQLWYRCVVINGLIEGIYEKYFNNGHVMERGNMINSFRDGEWEYGSYDHHFIRHETYDWKEERASWMRTITDIQNKHTNDLLWVRQNEKGIERKREYKKRETKKVFDI